MRSVTDRTNKKIDDLAARAKSAVTKAGDAVQDAAKRTGKKLRDAAQVTGRRIEDLGRRVAPSPAIPVISKRRGAGRASVSSR